MRIGIDFHFAERQGTGNCTYSRKLVEALLSFDRENEYFLYITDPKYPYYQTFRSMPNAHLRPLPKLHPLFRIPLLGLQTFADKIDILHMQYMAPVLHAGRLVTMIHDVSFLYFPQCFSRLERWRLKALLPMNIAKADRILTVSECSKKDIVKHYRIPSEKVVVTYNGVDPLYRPITDLNKEDFLRRFSLQKDFILFVGRINARKNIETLVEAFLRLKRTKGIPHQLAIIGNEDFLTPAMRQVLEIPKRRSEVFFIGYVQNEDLPLFYNLAAAFVFPSFYEGFGLPCLEAMACGCPVIASNTSSIPEVVGDAGLLVDPKDADGLAIAIDQVITDATLRQGLRDRGLRQVSKFSWQETAMRTLAVYRELAEKNTNQ